MPRIKRIIPKGYTTVNNDFLRDTTLSLAARGLLMTMLSLPDGWNMSGKGFAAILPDGRDKVYSTLNVLEEKGYLQREKIREGGRFVDMEYQFCDSPIFIGSNKRKKTEKDNISSKPKKKKTKPQELRVNPINLCKSTKLLGGYEDNQIKREQFLDNPGDPIMDVVSEIKMHSAEIHISGKDLNFILEQLLDIYFSHPELQTKLLSISRADVALIAERLLETGKRSIVADYFIYETPLLEL